MAGMLCRLCFAIYALTMLQVDSVLPGSTGVNNPWATYIESLPAQNPNVMPTNFATDPFVNVTYRLILGSIAEIDELSDKVSINAALYTEWNAEPAGIILPMVNNSEVTEFSFTDPATIWTPKSVVANMINLVDFRDAQKKTAVDVYASTTGTIFSWRLYSNFDLLCDFRLYSYPYDVQICTLNIIPIADFGFFGANLAAVPPICTAWLIENPQWSYLGSRINIDPNKLWGLLYSYTIQFAIQRKPDFYLMTIIAPVVMLAIVGCTIFIVPPASDEKMMISFSVLLSFFVLFASVTASLPPTSLEMPLLYWYLFSLFVISILSSVAAAVITRIAESIKVKDLLNKSSNRIDAVLNSDGNKQQLLSDDTLFESAAESRIQMINSAGIVVYLAMTIIVTLTIFSLIVEDMNSYSTTTDSNFTFTMMDETYYTNIDSLNLCFNCYTTSTNTLHCSNGNYV